ncbi:hypothetical protein [Pseudomonas syringae]|uniref:DUF3077 domain-containing protein n=1 Tax=Pseudomonas syringae pv. syringae TaxID=321 RepID=A0AAE5S7N0_PSESY|nr:hypothetical protein [Pseudomonas syringae]POQ03667.1 hypothetical protein CXB42_13390 [Pseudomonas syringae pv. syringae]
MTHLKNTTAPPKSQVAVTKAHDFRPINPAGDEILQVRSGVCVIDALEDSSCLLSEVLLFIRDHLDEDAGLKVSGVYLLQEHLINAKAVLDASVSGLMAQRSGGAP